MRGRRFAVGLGLFVAFLMITSLFVGFAPHAPSTRPLAAPLPVALPGVAAGLPVVAGATAPLVVRPLVPCPPPGVIYPVFHPVGNGDPLQPDF
jgi:hypothetical protein